MNSPDWKPILAALGNEAARTVFARAALGTLSAGARAQLNTRETKALQSWLALGVLSEVPDDGPATSGGDVTVDGAALRATLAAPQASAEPKARDVVGKYLVEGRGPRIQTLPAGPAERRELLLWVRDAALRPGEVLTEPQLNERLRVFHEDVALIRRYLVDHGLLERTLTGTEYALPAD